VQSRKQGAGLAGLGVMMTALRRREAAELEAERERRRQAALRQAESQRDHDLFMREVGPVQPLKATAERVLHRPQSQPAVPRQRQLDEARVMRDALSDEFDAESLLETDERLGYGAPGIGDDVVRRLRRGVWAVQGQVDLHGLTRELARVALGQFFDHAARQGWRCVRIVHGKGLGSPGRQPVLKAKVQSWLMQHRRVLAFTQARGPDGGAGALIVLLDRGIHPGAPRRV
jgi:DNA-nicking Smr family endonuclease